ncbi:MAG: phenylalanine--tRNA ligase subunit alpha [Clostridia bacterium]|jgi:phenylalanyl-tRNA synthetase alpha chain|nr:phenylalanine--tRNA ligase subunit alpha [Clostridia bacterium]
MKNKIAEIENSIESAVQDIQSSKTLQEIKMKFLGKTGEITSLMKNMRDVPPEQRPSMGKLLNALREWTEERFNTIEKKIKQIELSKKYQDEKIDVTMPGNISDDGAYHPNTLVRNELVSIFAGMGFEVFEGPEIENDYYNFTALNTPSDHPARDMQDTFYITDDLLLRTQTSAGQIRVMENKKPPIKILSPGKVYRSDDDATHSPMFSQMEGLVVDKGITLCDLKGMLDEFAKRIFGAGVKTRLRPSYFPFTEPSVEVDVSCFECGGKGCRLCKGTGWIEVLGAGMVNRRVLEGCGIDPDEYTGFAFGMGIERIAMLKYGVNNMKLLFEGDTRFLKQFKG